MKTSSIISSIEESAATVASLRENVAQIEAACEIIVNALKAGNKVLTAGNGGSAADALHASEELIGRFKGNRRSLPSVALTADCTALTCIGNDYGFDEIFSRQVEGLGNKNDVLIIFSTSGKAQNLQNAVRVAAEKGIKTILILGRDGGPLAGKGDCEIIVKGNATERIQEAHTTILHILLDAVEQEQW